MSTPTLRQALTKLAAEKPELRKHLLPLLKQAAWQDKMDEFTIRDPAAALNRERTLAILRAMQSRPGPWTPEELAVATRDRSGAGAMADRLNYMTRSKLVTRVSRDSWELTPKGQQTKTAAGRDDIAIFKAFFPYHNELDAINEAEHTGSHNGALIGNGRFEIPPQRAQQLERAGFAMVTSAYDTEFLVLTDKGEKELERGEEAWRCFIL